MKHLYYIRHGESVYNAQQIWAGRAETPLNEKGHEQARLAAKSAAEQGLKFDVIISSPLSRTRQTARYIAEATGYPTANIQLHEGFLERSYGVLEGVQDNTAMNLYKQDEALIDTYQGVERLIDMQWRAQQMLDYISALPHDTILIAGHGAFGRALRRAIYKEPLHERGQQIENAKIIKLI